MRVQSQTDTTLVTQDNAAGWGLATVLVGVAVIFAAMLPGAALPDGPKLAVISGGAMVVLIGATLLTSVTAVFDRETGELTWCRRFWGVNRRRVARLDEVHEVVLQSRRDETGRSYRPAISLRGEIWPLGGAFRDKASAQRVIDAAERFFNGGDAR